MCLKVSGENLERKIAEEDIVCYKILKKCNFLLGTNYLTPYRHMLVSNEVIKGKKPLIAKGKEDIRHYAIVCPQPFCKIYGGFIHTFVRKMKYLNYTDCLFECVIPKGTEYFTDGQMYASKQIIFKRQIV